MSTYARCKLNSDGSVCLKDILNSFNTPIKEEQAWALFYQCCKYSLQSFAANKESCYEVTELKHIYLQTDGNIHANTLFGVCGHSDSRKRLKEEQELVSGLGTAIYSALDYGMTSDEERAIGQDLEQLISDMISESRQAAPHQETDDEGIEKDAEESQETGSVTLQHVIMRCEKHLHELPKNLIEAHYRAVVRALVTEALELSTFLEKVSQGTGSLHLISDGPNVDLDHLQFADWARFWVQVIGELRMGVKLRKVHYTKAPIEYELTPYEILMKDIRSCRYNLKKIMVDGDIPYKVAKDAHALILEFIRSRPPLKKASERKLPPAVLKLSPHEQLMNSIRKGRNLKATPGRFRRSDWKSQEPVEGVEKSSGGRKLIRVDFSQLEDDDEDEDEDSSQTDGSSVGENLWNHEEYHQLHDVTLEAYDLATLHPNYCGSGHLRYYPSSYSVPQSRPGSRQSCNSSEAESIPAEMSQSMQERILGNKTWPEGMTLEDRLSLTLEEIVHIRSVLTKAELEALPIENHIKSDVEARKVCFLCLKTRFGIFGPWGQRCSLCKKTVCARCYCRMNIPMEYFSGVPVVLLSPSILGTPDDPRSRRSSPGEPEAVLPKPGTSQDHKDVSPLHRFRMRASNVGRTSAVIDKLKSSNLIAVCHDCRMMVLQIIKSGRTNRSAVRNRTLQNLSLNLSPVF